MMNEDFYRQMEFIKNTLADMTVKQQIFEEESKERFARSERRMDRLENVLKAAIRAGLRERREWRQKHNALIDAQMRSEEKLVRLEEGQARSQERLNEQTEAQVRADLALERLAEAQARTEAATANLGKGPDRVEEKLDRLAEAQAQSEVRVARLEEAQARTEATMNRLAEEQASLGRTFKEFMEALRRGAERAGEG